MDYDELYGLLRHEREHGRIVWVLGPAVVFDFDARSAFVSLVRHGYVHAVLAGNALAVHDIEASSFGTALGQHIYSRQGQPHGHYNHLDVINAVRGAGSIAAAIDAGLVADGVMHALHARRPLRPGRVHPRRRPPARDHRRRLPGPGPHACRDRRGDHGHRPGHPAALHRHGNLTPSYAVRGAVRPVYFYRVDMSDFVTTKLANRGSSGPGAVLTNGRTFSSPWTGAWAAGGPERKAGRARPSRAAWLIRTWRRRTWSGGRSP
ncbi:hypothetical protein MASR1M66_21270 [Aminivibrio sp.]